MAGLALTFSLALALLTLPLEVRLAGLSGQTPSAEKPPAKKEKKVWTNEDLEELRNKPGVSVIGQGALPAEGEKPAVEKPPGEPYDRDKDSKWYREQLAPLRAELERIDSEIRRLRGFKSNPYGGQGGLVLSQPNISLSPENQIEQLERRRSEVQRQIDDMEDQARRNGIPPGLLR